MQFKVLLAAYACALASAAPMELQPVKNSSSAPSKAEKCSSFKTSDLGTTPANSSLLSVLEVQEEMEVGAVAVKDLSVSHSQVGALKVCYDFKR